METLRGVFPTNDEISHYTRDSLFSPNTTSGLFSLGHFAGIVSKPLTTAQNPNFCWCLVGVICGPKFRGLESGIRSFSSPSCYLILNYTLCTEHEVLIRLTCTNLMRTLQFFSLFYYYMHRICLRVL